MKLYRECLCTHSMRKERPVGGNFVSDDGHEGTRRPRARQLRIQHGYDGLLQSGELRRSLVR